MEKTSGHILPHLVTELWLLIEKKLGKYWHSVGIVKAVHLHDSKLHFSISTIKNCNKTPHPIDGECRNGRNGREKVGNN